MCVSYTDGKLDRGRLSLAELHLQNIKNIHDAGCGGGKYSIYFAGRGYRVTAIDRDPACLKALQEKTGKQQPEIRIIKKTLEDFFSVQGAADKNTALLLFDVLEHCENDLSLLKKIKKKKYSRIFITVPHETPEDLVSRGVVFSTYQDLTHQRYYTEKSLSALISRAGFGFFFIRPFNFLYTPALIPAFFRKENIINRLLLFLLAGRLRVARYRNYPTTLFACISQDSPLSA